MCVSGGRGGGGGGLQSVNGEMLCVFQGSKVVVAANSQGTVKILEVV